MTSSSRVSRMPVVSVDEADTHNVRFLKAIRCLKGVRQGLTLQEIEKKTRMQNLVRDMVVRERLEKSADIQLLPDGRLLYMPQHGVYERADIGVALRRMPMGIPLSELKECYDGIGEDLAEMHDHGDVIVVYDPEQNDDVYFLRPGGGALVPLSHTATLESNSVMVEASGDVSEEIRPGDALLFDLSRGVELHPEDGDPSVGGAGRGRGRRDDSSARARLGPNTLVWHRVSLGQLRSVQLQRLFYSVCSHKPSAVREEELLKDGIDLPCGNEFELKSPHAGPSLQRVPVRRYGCTNDVRDLWDAVGRDVEREPLMLYQTMLSKSLLTRESFDELRRRTQVRAVHSTAGGDAPRQRKRSRLVS